MVLGLSLGVAAAYNALSSKPLPWIAVEPVYEKADISSLTAEETPVLTPAPAELKQITIEQAKELFDGGKAMFLDARPENEYAEGHIKGALNMPYEHWEEYSSLLPGLEGRPVITYCSGKECKASVHLAERLQELGFSPIFIFFGGWPEWQKAAYPAEPLP